MSFADGATDDELFYEVPELDTCNFDNYNGFSTSPVVGPFGSNYVYSAARQFIDIISYITVSVLTVCTVSALVRYCINGLSGRNSPVDIKKYCNLFLFDPDNIVIKTLEVTTQLGSFNQRLLMQQFN